MVKAEAMAETEEAGNKGDYGNPAGPWPNTCSAEELPQQYSHLSAINSKA